MKNIFLIMIGGLLCYNTWGQCSPLNVSTDPQNPFNDKVGQNVQFFSHLNNFDWQTSYYTINGYVAPALNSPFEENNNSITFNKLSTNSGIKDYYVEDGWELLNENVTSSSSLTNPTDIVYFTFYNKYSSVIRVLFAMEETWFPFQSVSVELKLGDPNINAMFHPMGNIGQALDKASSEAVIVSVPMAANEYYFMIADFPVEYDPCVCFKNNLSKINASFELVNEQAINWLGNLSIDNSMVNLVSDAENSSRGELSFAGTSSIDDDITKGALIFRSIDNLMDK